MKILIKFFTLLIISFSFFSITNSADITVKTTEDLSPLIESCQNDSCNIKKNGGTLKEILSSTVKYATFLASLGAVLFIVVNGIMYSMSGIDAGMKDAAKKRIGKTLAGLVLLLLSGVLLNTIAPWIYK